MYLNITNVSFDNRTGKDIPNNDTRQVVYVTSILLGRLLARWHARLLGTASFPPVVVVALMASANLIITTTSKQANKQTLSP